MSGPWIGVDLDGTLARHTSGDDVDGVGAPIMPMVNRVKKMISDGHTVKIVTARVANLGGHELDQQVSRIRDWCERHIGKRLKITCSKDYAMICLFDDRAVAVEPNTGKLLSLDPFEKTSALMGKVGFGK